MTTLEKGKFIKIFVRDKDGKRLHHSNWRGYSKKDVEEIEPKIDSTYFENWERFLIDKKADDKLQAEYSDWPHFLYSLNEVSDADRKKYNLPSDFIIISY